MEIFITKKDDQFLLNFDYHPKIVDFIHDLQEKYGRNSLVFDRPSKTWSFYLPEILEEFRIEYPELQFSVQDNEPEFKKMNYSLIKNSDKIYEFQKEAVEFLNSKEGRGLLGMDMGTGKTLVALIYTTSLNLKTLIICPNQVKFTWADEIEKWTDRSFKVLSATDKKWDMSKDYTIMNYDIVYKFFNPVRSGRYKRWYLKDKFSEDIKSTDCIIVDESHFIKSTKARRSKAVKHLKIPKKLLLTGTPITNKPMDIWNQLDYLDHGRWGNWYDFRDRYTSGYFHPSMNFYIQTGTRNREELARNIKPYVFRKRKEEVLTELPTRVYNVISIDLTGQSRVKYNKAIVDFEEFLIQFTDLDTQQINRRLRAEALTRVQSLKQICSDYKVVGKKPAIKEMVDNIFENNPEDKIVIFSQYRRIVKELQKLFRDSVVIHGEVSPEDRAEAIKKFQENPEKKIFIGTTQVSGVGITLTSASNLIFIDLLWNPADSQQCVDRLHRIGQEKSVNVFYLLARNTIDETIYRLLQKKQMDIDTIIDGQKIKRPTNIFNQFLKEQIEKLKQ